MAVGWIVLVVFLVAVSQVECASIRKPEPLPDNHLDASSDSSDHPETPGSGAQKKSDDGILENQVKLKQIDPEKPPDVSDPKSALSDGLVTNSHTITSQDFAAMTGVVSEPQLDNTNLNDPQSSAEPKPKTKSDEKLNPSPDKNIPEDGKDTKSSSENEYPTLEENLTNDEENKELETSDGNTLQEEVEESSISENKSDESKSDESLEVHYDNISEVSLYDLAQSISDDIKVYSNEAAMNWEEKKGDASWTLEAEGVLKDYMDKISIAQSANNSNCVKKDLENHASRANSLKDVTDSCRSNQKREDWHKLQDVTKNTLEKITEIVNRASSKIEKLPNDDKYNSMKISIENEAKKELLDLNTDDLKNKLSKMKDKTIKSDGEEYTNCLDNKPEKAMIVDTLNDIMRIKNNCVG